MSHSSIVLVGAPDTGKTNFLARLWEALRTKRGSLTCPIPPDDIKYVEDALNHLLQGEFAPRSNKNIEEGRSDIEFSVRLAASESDDETKVLVPDITGELWKNVVKALEIPKKWLDDLKGATSAVLFVRVQSELNVAPLDWVTAKKLLRREHGQQPNSQELPTQVLLCELFRFVEMYLRKSADGALPRLAVLVTAWDRLDRDASKTGPTNYLRAQFPMFAGRLADSDKLDVRVFGLSVVGGDLADDPDFKKTFLASDDFSKAGYVVYEHDNSNKISSDITLPLAWLLGAKLD